MSKDTEKPRKEIQAVLDYYQRVFVSKYNPGMTYSVLVVWNKYNESLLVDIKEPESP